MSAWNDPQNLPGNVQLLLLYILSLTPPLRTSSRLHPKKGNECQIIPRFLFHLWASSQIPVDILWTGNVNKHEDKNLLLRRNQLLHKCSAPISRQDPRSMRFLLYATLGHLKACSIDHWHTADQVHNCNRMETVQFWSRYVPAICQTASIKCARWPR